MRTYSRRGIRRGAIITTAAPAPVGEDFGDEDVLQARKRVRMDVRGLVVEDEVFVVPGSSSRDDGAVIPVRPPSPPLPRPDEVLAAASSSTVPSSPLRSERALFSDDVPYGDLGSVSPLSSPPPELPSPPPATRKPAFSSLKRKRLSRHDPSSDPPSEPLVEVAHNIVKKACHRGKKRSLTQMQIDLGGEVRRSCKICGMEFIPSNQEDNALHEKFCAIGRQGVDIGQSLFKDKGITRLQTTKGSRRWKEIVVIVDRRSSGGARKQAQRVLDFVNAELSASKIRDEELWGVIQSVPADPKRRNIRAREAKIEEPEARGDRFKVFMYLVDAKCAGFCLAEKISSAYRTVDSETGETQQQQHLTLPTKGSSVSISAEADVALVGISRIWTSKIFRNKGIATMLLDCVRGNFFYGMEVPKDLVAFSQPTESGGRLAKCWFEAPTGWHVYTEEHP